MSKKTVLKEVYCCDNCALTEERYAEPILSQAKERRAWIEVEKTGDYFSEDWLFCSESCLTLFFSKRSKPEPQKS